MSDNHYSQYPGKPQEMGDGLAHEHISSEDLPPLRDIPQSSTLHPSYSSSHSALSTSLPLVEHSFGASNNALLSSRLSTTSTATLTRNNNNHDNSNINTCESKCMMVDVPPNITSSFPTSNPACSPQSLQGFQRTRSDSLRDPGMVIDLSYGQTNNTLHRATATLSSFGHRSPLAPQERFIPYHIATTSSPRSPLWPRSSTQQALSPRSLTSASPPTSSLLSSTGAKFSSASVDRSPLVSVASHFAYYSSSLPSAPFDSHQSPAHPSRAFERKHESSTDLDLSSSYQHPVEQYQQRHTSWYHSESPSFSLLASTAPSQQSSHSPVSSRPSSMESFGNAARHTVSEYREYQSSSPSCNSSSSHHHYHHHHHHDTQSQHQHTPHSASYSTHSSQYHHSSLQPPPHLPSHPSPYASEENHYGHPALSHHQTASSSSATLYHQGGYMEEQRRPSVSSSSSSSSLSMPVHSVYVSHHPLHPNAGHDPPHHHPEYGQAGHHSHLQVHGGGISSTPHYSSNYGVAATAGNEFAQHHPHLHHQHQRHQHPRHYASPSSSHVHHQSLHRIDTSSSSSSSTLPTPSVSSATLPSNTAGIASRPPAPTRTSTTGSSSLSTRITTSTAAATSPSSPDTISTFSASSAVPRLPTTSAESQPRRRRRPNESYSNIIIKAILNSEHKRLRLSEIYEYVKKEIPQFGDDKGWQNTVRHNLSLNPCFRRESVEEGAAAAAAAASATRSPTSPTEDFDEVTRAGTEGASGGSNLRGKNVTQKPARRGKGGYWVLDMNELDEHFKPKKYGSDQHQQQQQQQQDRSQASVHPESDTLQPSTGRSWPTTEPSVTDEPILPSESSTSVTAIGVTAIGVTAPTMMAAEDHQQGEGGRQAVGEEEKSSKLMAIADASSMALNMMDIDHEVATMVIAETIQQSSMAHQRLDDDTWSQSSSRDRNDNDQQSQRGLSPSNSDRSLFSDDDEEDDAGGDFSVMDEEREGPETRQVDEDMEELDPTVATSRSQANTGFSLRHHNTRRAMSLASLLNPVGNPRAGEFSTDKA